MPQSNADPETYTGYFVTWLHNIIATLRAILKPETRDEQDEGEVECEREREREGIINKLQTIYQGIKEERCECFDANELLQNDIKCNPLPLDGQPTPASHTFFTPMAKEEREQHPLDLAHKGTKYEYEVRGWPWIDMHLPKWLTSPKGASEAAVMGQRHSRAQVLCSLVDHFFTRMKRKGPGSERSMTLMDITGWDSGNRADSLVDREFAPDLFNSVTWSSLCESFEARNNLPHAMFTMASGYTPINKAICRSEILAILAIMISHLRKPSLKGHKIIPVKVISFFGNEGRVLESHFDSDYQHLVIKVSDFYDFSSQDVGLAHADLFLYQMASKQGGETKFSTFSD